ncbi:hypothetical protein HHI36_001571, partial [Cryptolaemus montrouzieri]
MRLDQETGSTGEQTCELFAKHFNSVFEPEKFHLNIDNISDSENCNVLNSIHLSEDEI